MSYDQNPPVASAPSETESAPEQRRGSSLPTHDDANFLASSKERDRVLVRAEAASIDTLERAYELAQAAGDTPRADLLRRKLDRRASNKDSTLQPNKIAESQDAPAVNVEYAEPEAPSTASQKKAISTSRKQKKSSTAQTETAAATIPKSEKSPEASPQEAAPSLSQSSPRPVHGSIIDIDVNKITVGNRHRKDMGDVAGLAENMGENGLFQPIGITSENVLIFGERRLRAAKLLGWLTISARVVNLIDMITAEYAENEMRKDFTKSECVAISKSIKAAMKERRGKVNMDNCPGLKGKLTRDVVAQKSGFKNAKDMERSTAVVDKGVPAVVAAVDSGAVSVSVGAKVSQLPAATQEKLAVAGPEAMRNAVKDTGKKKNPAAQAAPEVSQPATSESGLMRLAGPDVVNKPKGILQLVFNERLPDPSWLRAVMKDADVLGVSVLATSAVVVHSQPKRPFALPATPPESALFA